MLPRRCFSKGSRPPALEHVADEYVEQSLVFLMEVVFHHLGREHDGVDVFSPPEPSPHKFELGDCNNVVA